MNHTCAIVIYTCGTFYTKMSLVDFTLLHKIEIGISSEILTLSVPIFNTTYHTITICENPFWCLTHAGGGGGGGTDASRSDTP